MDFEARWFPVLYALREKSSQPVTTLASSLRLTHPAINQIAGDMEKHGYVASRRDKKDERKRLLRLTPKGKQLIKNLEPVWRIIESETQRILKNSGGRILKSMQNIEEALDEKDMYERVMERLKSRYFSKIEILDYKPQYKKYFKELNYEWLEKYFQVEPQDEKILSDPNKYVIKPGGFILFAKYKGRIVGTTAVMKHTDSLFELTKMAVTESEQGKYIGEKLAIKAIEKSRNMGATELILHTSPKLKPAIALYEKLGFEKSDEPDLDLPKYKRRTIVMRLDL
ncbi:MAG: bifunctional helix-turn-helix transcriptional regulator/GNAT family N-acetyltransferase [candidate division Zixibacteria bacterium]|nr:bifunctional helix-turn-helix transcriptional regulator/GNAT family N-acetyltransferase [candidate division Zixibacteria bacterium]NIR64974.1 bifunctional helix-turn-helix transcriptional regulator/GNAT family N-acetyltransferase [candidate division Zixibacteria bacterium]NIS17974.1 bifunctional helix-turn-helix transcriptional regulator/GNAT family N-acetyltransferase [candidate division Zixibacteria bacterium]NIS46781.1 bifunctional helix-turn-helix transcriptional regulator/GNAT family N-a